jgi:hypothetical protein
MEINITTPALLFPAISLLLLAYTNRFLTLAGIVRGLANRLKEHDDTGNLDRQIDNLRLRIQLIKWMQFCGVLSFSCCVISMMLLFVDREISARYVFAASLILLLISLAVSAWETLLSGEALRLELERCGKKSRASR